jgi:imidazolonepropionase-like amidohydrolase
MNMKFSSASWLVCFSLLASTNNAHAEKIAFVGGTLLPISSKPINDGVLLINEGKIVGLGQRSKFSIPSDYTIKKIAGQVLMPGIVDTHSHLGIGGDSNEGTPLNASLRIMDSFWPADPRIKTALSGGITTANVMPGSGSIISGQTMYIKLRGQTVEDMIVDGSIGGMKMANGENPKGRGGSGAKAPSTRMATAAMARQQFDDAMAYRDKKQKATDKGELSSFAINLGHEALLEVLDKKRTVHHHTHRTDDIMTVLRLKKEFGFRLVLQHGIESYKIADEVAKYPDVSVSYIVVDSPGGKVEATGANLTGAAKLEQAGIDVALHSDDGIIDSRFLIRTAALAVRGGMTREAALKALTLTPAKMLELDHKVGSLDKGKDADFIILNGDPLSVYTHVQQTWIEGQLVFDRNNKKDKLYSTGGHKVADRYPHLGGSK